MSYNNVKLWFAKDYNENIVTIDEINECNNTNTYHCPVCGSDLTPKATKSKRITPHFAHVDASKCNSESQIHFWFKHKFLEAGDKFTVVAEKVKEYVCKEVLVEQSYETESGKYRPDVTVLTECGNTIYFEMAFSNKKKVKDYLDIWLELKNIVVEVDIKQLIFKDKISTFKALFYEGKCFNTKRNDTYYNTIGKYKEEKLKGNVDGKLKERIRKLDWFWDDVFRYKKGEVDIGHIANLIDGISDKDREILNKILNKNKCQQVYEDFMNFKLDNSFRKVKEYLKLNLNKECLRYLNKQLIKYKDGMKAFIVIKSFYLIGRSRSIYCKFNGYHKGGSNDFYNISEYKQQELNEIILNKMKINLKYIEADKITESYELKCNELLEKIRANQAYKNIINIASSRNANYELESKINNDKYIDSCKIVNGDINMKSLEDFNANFNLKFNGNVVFKYEERIYTFDNVNNICKNMNCSFLNYFNKLIPFANFSEIDSLVNELNDTYSAFGIKVQKQLISEDTFSLHNHGKYNGFHIGENYKISSLDDISKIKSVIISDIRNFKHRKVCKDCCKGFDMTTDEMMFFANKKLHLPKRCKPCREKSKQNK